ncbi:MAG: RagB/SusD family nutrient uptake outer membrane protein [Cyclobacteriaceae bacterium]|nr:RagB/SusD family nutrient uptake outer membrane protein [Cyclobacteriaceae bacterium]
MKILIKYKYAVLFLVLLLGCNKEFLEPNEELVLSLEEYYATLDESTISGLTSNMYGSDWFRYLDNSAACIQEIYSGNSFSGSGGFVDFFNGTLNPTSSRISWAWQSHYTIIKRANDNLNGFYEAMQPDSEFLDRMAASPEFEKAVNTTLGELRFFRAISYFNLVQLFGPIPLAYDNSKQLSDPESWKPIAEEDLYTYIIMDLEDAIAKLPENRNPAQTNRLSKVSAKALLAKVYLTRGGESFGQTDDFTKAAQLSDEVINNTAGYRLMESYAENFDPKYSVDYFPEECLWGWTWQWTALFGSYGTQNVMQSQIASGHFTGSWDGWSTFVPSVDLVESFDADDQRRHATFMENGNYYPEFWTEYTFPGQANPGYVYYDGKVWWGTHSQSGTHIRKHLAGRANSADGHIGPQHTEVYTPIIRLSDLYLTYAEAILGKNSSTSDAKALGYFNTIRDRAGLEPLSSISYADIWNERRHEFAFEFQSTNDLFRYHNLHPQEAINLLLNQRRGEYGFQIEPVIIDGKTAKDPFGVELWQTIPSSKVYDDFKLTVVDDSYFQIPYPIEEINGNPFLNDAPARFDFDNYK